MIGTQRFSLAGTVFVALAVIIMPLVLPSVTLASEVVTFATATLSCTLLLGSIGVLSFGQGLYFGTGAYITGILLRDAGWATLPSVLTGTLLPALAAAALALVAVRRSGVYFVMLTLAFAQMGYFAMLALRDVTGGENGFTGVPSAPLLPGLAAVVSPIGTYAVIGTLAILAFAGAARLLASPFGSVLTAIRENETRAEALGYDVRRFKVAISAICGGIGGLAGSMQVLYLGLVPPNSIDLPMSERLLMMSILGGAGAPVGAFLGAGAYAFLSEVLTPLWPRWLIVVAGLLIVIVLFLRGGLLGGLLALRTRLKMGRRDA